MSQRSQLALPTLFLLIASCSSGGDGGGGGNTVTGQFVDSAVDGLAYEADDTSGLTDNAGRFTVPTGSTVRFFIGGIELGSASAAEFITPVSLVPGASDENHPTVQNIARLLQSLDSNGDPLDGIHLTGAVRTAAEALDIDLTQTSAAFEADSDLATLLAAAGAAGLVSTTDAANHLALALTASHAGLYEGTFGGDDSGSFAVVLDRIGNILGAAVANSDPGELIGVSGTIQTDGSGAFGNATSGATFAGSVDGGAFSGTWENTFFGEDGTYSGSVEGSPEPFVEDLLPFVRTYGGTFELGNAPTTFTAIVDARGHISVSTGDGSSVVALVESVSGSTARIVGISDIGTVVTGTITSSGAISGDLDNDFLGESGSFSGQAL